MDKAQIISYLFYVLISCGTILISYGIIFIAKEYQSYYEKILAIKGQEETRAQELLEIQNYNKAKQTVVDTVYKFEEIGKQFAYDGMTKHSLVAEEASKLTGLSDEQIFDIIKTTVGIINSSKVV